MRLRSVVGGLCIGLGAVGGAHASLTTLQTYVGSYGLSTDGWGSTTQSGSITASVPVSSTVVGAYLYSSMYSSGTPGGTFGGSTLGASTALGVTAGLQAYRWDVTSIVKAAIDGGPGGTYNFAVTETSSLQDGYALVVVYGNTGLPEQTVAILDGFSATTGDSTALNFASPLNPSAPGFVAEMRLGIGFSYDGTGCTDSAQTSTVKVNGTAITNSAGCNDDSKDATANNGNLITVGGNNDPLSPSLPSVASDHERYSLVSLINNGDTTIAVNTVNPSNNDNIFLAAFLLTGRAGVNQAPTPTTPPTGTPEPGSIVLLGLGMAALLARRRRTGSD